MNENLLKGLFVCHIRPQIFKYSNYSNTPPDTDWKGFQMISLNSDKKSMLLLKLLCQSMQINFLLS